MLDKIRIILVEPSHPGNIGAAARAMKNMGLTELALVNPRFFPHDEATARAAGAGDILEHAQVYHNLTQAIKDCQWVIGCTALLRNTEQLALTPRVAAETVRDKYAGAGVAYVFGRERSGLTNEELQQCHAQLQIPANPLYSSLNLGTAVQIICYELWLAAQVKVAALATHDYATVAQQENFYHRLDQIMLKTGFLNPNQPRSLHKKLRAIFTRINLTTTEIDVLMGLLKSIDKKIESAD